VSPSLHASDQQLFSTACHNAGHALAYLTNGHRIPALTIEPCHQLGLQQVPDRTIWSVICWAGPAAEAVAATHAGATDEEAAAWMWSRYHRNLPPGAIACRRVTTTDADPAVLAVALAIATANWTHIGQLAQELTGVHASSGAPGQKVNSTDVLICIDTEYGEDIGVPFDRWQQAIMTTKS
jgi:hypothetical protein